MNKPIARLFKMNVLKFARNELRDNYRGHEMQEVPLRQGKYESENSALSKIQSALFFDKLLRGCTSPLFKCSEKSASVGKAELFCNGTAG